MASGTTPHGLPYPLETDAFDPAADAQQLATAVDTNYESAYAISRVLLEAGGRIDGSTTSAATYVLLPGTASLQPGVQVSGGARYLDPADYAATSRTTKLRLRAQVVTNAVQPATLTVGLFPVTFSFGASGAASGVTFGTVVSGSSITIGSPPAASSSFNPTSGDFTAPTAGWYAIGLTTSAGNPASAITSVQVRLEVHNV